MDELFQQLMARVPDPSQYAQQELQQPLSEFPGSKTGEVPNLELYSLLKKLPAMIQMAKPAVGAVRNMFKPMSEPAKALVKQLETPLPAPNLAGAVAGNRITSTFQKMAPRPRISGYTLPRPSMALPKTEVAKEIAKERKALIQSANKTQRSFGMPKRGVGSAPSSGGGVDAILAAKGASQAGAVKSYSPEQIAELNRQILANAPPSMPRAALPRPSNGTLMNDPTLREAILNRGTKTLDQLAKEYGISRRHLTSIVKRLGVETPRANRSPYLLFDE